MLDQIFGIELECVLDDSHLKKIRDEIGNLYVALDPFVMGVKCLMKNISLPDIDVKRVVDKETEAYSRWIVSEDLSLHTVNGFAFELISPVLRGWDGICEVQKRLADLERVGMRKDHRAGLHVHIDCRNVSNTQLRSIAACFVRYEEQLDTLVHCERRYDRCRHARSNLRSARISYGEGDVVYRDPGEVAAAVLLLPVTDEHLQPLMDYVCPKLLRKEQSSRYHKLNLNLCASFALGHHRRRIEFRSHHGTTDPVAVAAWIRFMSAFVAAALRFHASSESMQDLPRDMWRFTCTPDLEEFYEHIREDYPSHTPAGFTHVDRDAAYLSSCKRAGICMHDL